MLTPWFAVSVGIVVATSLTLTTPHPALTFPPSRGARCVEAACAAPSPPPSAPSPAIKHDVRLRAKAPAGIKFEYKLLPQHDSHFMAVIVISGRKKLGKWRLKFVLPGAQIDAIMWAKWRPKGPDGVLVTGSPSPWPRSGANEARIVVFGTGTPGWPKGCVFDGGTCKFIALTSSDSPAQTDLLHLGSGWTQQQSAWPSGGTGQPPGD